MQAGNMAVRANQENNNTAGGGQLRTKLESSAPRKKLKL
jgi:hypothetical protein